MITIEEYYMIKCLKNKGMSIMQISREMGVDRKTVSNWLFFASTFCRKLQVKNTECCIMENP